MDVRAGVVASIVRSFHAECSFAELDWKQNNAGTRDDGSIRGSRYFVEFGKVIDWFMLVFLCTV
jgi:hypothetical protein